MKRFLILCLIAFIFINVRAQRHEVLSGDIASLTVMANDSWQEMPLIALNSGDCINISFDDLTHVEHRYLYRVEHCEYDWRLSEQLFESDYVEGFADGLHIEDISESVNTNTLYTHYSFSLPNKDCRLKLSGNYRVTVYDDDKQGDDAIVFRAYFMVCDQQVQVALGVTSVTDQDINGRHQQIYAHVGYNSMKISDWERELKFYVLQNGRWDNVVSNPKPQYVQNDALTWDHCRELIFNGGNEYRRFELLDMNRSSVGIEHIDWDGADYHAYVWLDEERRNYVYEETSNGGFLIRNSDDIENDTESDYSWVHFSVQSPRVAEDVYLNGNLTYDSFLPLYRLTYNDNAGCYEGKLFLKQGYYSYQYVTLSDKGVVNPLPSEGNFYETENVYQMLVYYRPLGGRTDQLIGYAAVSTYGE